MRTYAQRLGALIKRVELRVLLVGLLIAAGLWLFVGVAGEVREGETAGLDRRLLLALRTPGDLSIPIGPRWLQESARDLTALGGFTTLTLISVLAFAILMLHGRRMQAAIFAGAVILAQVLSELIKHAVARARPDLVPQHDLIYSSSFPSGHAMMTPVVYLTLAAILAAGEKRRTVRIVLVASALALVVAVGVSRVYLGVHWPTDVLAGWTLGSMLALIAWLALDRVAPKRAPNAEVKPDAPGAS